MFPINRRRQRDFPPVDAESAAGARRNASGSAAGRRVSEGKKRMVAALVNGVSDGELRVVAGVGHNELCFRCADVVVQAIRDVVDRTWTLDLPTEGIAGTARKRRWT